MASTTIDLDTELSAVNSILGAIGQSPLTTLNFDNPEVAMIYNHSVMLTWTRRQRGGILTQRNT